MICTFVSKSVSNQSEDSLALVGKLIFAKLDFTGGHTDMNGGMYCLTLFFPSVCSIVASWLEGFACVVEASLISRTFKAVKYMFACATCTLGFESDDRRALFHALTSQ